MNFRQPPERAATSREATTIYHRGHREYRETRFPGLSVRCARCGEILTAARTAALGDPHGEPFHGYRLDANFAKSIHDEAVAFVVPRQGNICNGGEFRVVARFLAICLTL